MRTYRVVITKVEAHFVEAENEADAIAAGQELSRFGFRPAYSVDPVAVAQPVAEMTAA